MIAPAPARGTSRRSSANRLAAGLFRIQVALFIVLPLGPPTAARAQVALSASVASDYRYRGLSLSDGRPTLNLYVAYDIAGGGYVGGSIIGEDIVGDGPQLLGHAEYLGYAFRAGRGITWDIGVTNINYVQYIDHRIGYNNTETYLGLRHGGLSYYLHYSPHYFAGGVNTLYAEINGTVWPAPRWRLFGHLGALTPLGGGGQPGPREQYDLRAGVATRIRDGELQLAWTVHRPDGGYLPQRIQNRDALMLAATWFF